MSQTPRMIDQWTKMQWEHHQRMQRRQRIINLVAGLGIVAAMILAGVLDVWSRHR